MSLKLSAREAKALARDIVENGAVDITGHAWKDLMEHDMSAGDVFNILCGGAYTEAEWENGEWRHQALLRSMRSSLPFITKQDASL